MHWDTLLLAFLIRLQRNFTPHARGIRTVIYVDHNISRSISYSFLSPVSLALFIDYIHLDRPINTDYRIRNGSERYFPFSKFSSVIHIRLYSGIVFVKIYNAAKIRWTLL